MLETWLLELVKGIGKLFLNPLFYWIIILVTLASYNRIKMERQHFGVKIFVRFTEMKNTWLPAIIVGLMFSIAMIAAGVVFSYGTLLALSVITILLSLNLRFTLLSASYTIGLTYILLLFLPTALGYQNVIEPEFFAETNFTALTFLLGFVLIIEAVLMRRVKRNQSFPKLVMSDRGIWIGQHRLEKLSVIPMLLIVPGGMIEPFAPYWPLLEIGENGSYGFILFPFLLGFSHTVRGTLVPIAAKSLSKQIIFLGIIVIIVSAAGLYIDGMSLAALILAILGREFITYRFRVKDKKKNPYFQPHPNGLKVLGVIPGTPAERLEIQTGEVITKVNEQKINSPDMFYEALQGSGAYFKLEVLDDQNEIRFVQSPFYEGDHYRLGLIFMKEPYRLNK
ncbi:PDZ domain-containing protein [Ralstonia pickettii]|nr:PDZ domain-containing protein [Ralstonia pickettii]